MGVRCKEKIILKSQDEFHAVDQIVTGLAFAVQNELGTFCDEKIYQEILAERCRKARIPSQREVEVVVSHGDFKKTYKLDLLLDNGIVYELKAVWALNASHKNQLLNYLLLLELRHGKLLNFHSSSVEYEYVSTSLTKKERRDFFVDPSEFLERTDRCVCLKNTLIDLLSDWGAYLDTHLYTEALIHFLGGEDRVIAPVDIFVENKMAGQQKMLLLDSQTVFHLSSINKAVQGYENNLSRLMQHTNMQRVHWINLNKNRITLKTIGRK
jgi:GxxExxY protein